MAVAAETKIEWCDATFNPWVGCTKVSPACDHCYAEGWARRTGQSALWAGARRRTTSAYWRQPLKWNRAAAASGIRRRVFCASLADVFDNQVPVEWRTDLWHLISETPALDWLLLTKRPQNIAKMLPGQIATRPCPWPNVWLGTTAENQQESERRIPHLLAAPAAKRFISAEPLLGPIDLRPYIGRVIRAFDSREDELLVPAPRLDLIIVGGESGPGARPMHPDWVRSIRDQCIAAGVPFFFKQNGEWSPYPMGTVGNPIDIVYLDGRSCNTTLPSIPASGERNSDGGVCMVRVGKKAAGAMLDGREHKEMPRG
jgi:protein gp37